MFQELMEVFVFLASPFADYQLNLFKLEAKFLKQQTQEISKEIQEASVQVIGPDADVQVLEDSIQNLESLATRVFGIAEGAVARFELLKGGFGSTVALSTWNQLLMSHTDELTSSIQKLTSTMTSDEQKLADHFDEAHVLASLQILKVTGRYHSHLQDLEGKTRQRMGLLKDRMLYQTKRSDELADALAKASSKTKHAFFVADSLSAVEINSVISQSIHEQDTVSVESLSRLDILYRPSPRLTQTCRTFVYTICASVPRVHLVGLSSLSSWTTTTATELYGILPQTYITHVGEHMLSLVQALEPFATDSEALKLVSMDGARKIAEQPWVDLLVASGFMNTSAELIEKLMDGKELEGLVLGEQLLEDEEDDPTEEDDDAKDVTAFCNAWLDIVGLAVTGRLLERIMRIPLLSPLGCQHLNADLNYLVNVFSALGVSGHPHPLLAHIAEIATLDENVLMDRIGSLDRFDELPSFLRCVEERIAAMRNSSS